MAAMLCEAVHDGNIRLLHSLLHAGASANAGDYDKRTALHIAAADGNLPAVRVMCKHAVCACHSGSMQCIPVAHGQVKVLKRLLLPCRSRCLWRLVVLTLALRIAGSRQLLMRRGAWGPCQWWTTCRRAWKVRHALLQQPVGCMLPA